MEDILRKISYHAVYDESILDALRFAKANGFAGIQVAVETPHLSLDLLSEAQVETIAEFCRTTDLSLCLHGPDNAASLFATSRHLKDGVFNYFEAMFASAERMGCRRITIHLGQMPTFRTSGDPAELAPLADVTEFRRALGENLSRLIDLADGRFALCVENVGWNALAMEAIQKHLDGRSLALCWDVAKSFGNEQVERFLRGNIAHVRQVHLHDLREGRSHQVMGTGQVPWVDYVPNITSTWIDDFCIEVRPREQALASLRYLQGLTKHPKS
jgi:sugar phosphate isomerase/epimerase